MSKRKAIYILRMEPCVPKNFGQLKTVAFRIFAIFKSTNICKYFAICVLLKIN